MPDNRSLRQAIVQVENALATLRRLDTGPDDGGDVEGHLLHSSDENLKRAITQIKDPMRALGAIRTAGL